jgi:RND superfamily putative drug exporter
LAWLIAAAVLAIFAPAPDPTLGETTDLLPSDVPTRVAIAQLARHFGDKSGLSAIVVVIENSQGPLTDHDLADVETIGRVMAKPLPGESIDTELASVSIRTPASAGISGPTNPLISDDGHAALIWMSLPYNYITKQAARLAKHTQAITSAYPFRTGISAAVTGSAGYGYSYEIATENSHNKTLVVTVSAVILILLFVYRAPLMAVIPLGGIGLAAAVAFKLLAFGDRFGLHSGSAEEIFTFVLLFGAGVDYSLLFMSRYREFLEMGMTSADSMAMGLDASLSSIGFSSLMSASGLVMLCFTRFSVFRHAGPAVVLAVIVAALSASTLVPALLAIIGERAFWPGHRRPVVQWKFWPALAQFVTHRPRLVLWITLIALLIPAVQGLHINWSYDALFSLKPKYEARRGSEMVQRHWPIGEIAPLNLLAASDAPQSFSQWQSASAAMIANLQAAPDVDNVRGLTAPLGLHVPPLENATALLLARDRVASEYLGNDDMAMRFSVVLKIPPLSQAAMDDAPLIVQSAQTAAGQSGVPLHFYLTGATAEAIDLKTVTQQDFQRISGLAVLAILIVVTAVLRDLLLSIVILSATALSYFTTVGLTYWVFQMLGWHGLEWKVQMLLFIVLIAVGQDYSIFFAMRLSQEARHLPCVAATEKAVIFTGPVISSCGLIMAATLGSLMAGDVQTLIQLGFAFALGMLLDTFIVRPLLLPAFVVLTGRTLPRAAVHFTSHLAAPPIIAPVTG